MRITMFPAKNVVAAVSLCAAALTAAACADGPGVPTGPTTTAMSSSLAANDADGSQGYAVVSASPKRPLLLSKTCDAIDHSVSYKTDLGTCVFTSGTGALKGFHANLKVSSDFSSNPAGVFTWDGIYHFVGRD